MNINCVICSDLFLSADSVFTTPCGHVFHHACLVQWLERSKSCPQCRNKCTERSIFRLYFNNMVNMDPSSTQSTANLLETVDNMTLQIREKEMSLKAAEENKAKLEDSLKSKEKRIDKLETSASRNTQIIATMRHEMDILSSHRASLKAIENENVELKSRLDLMQSIESVLSASQKEVDEILKQKMNAEDLAVMVGTLRRELGNNETRKNELRKQLNSIKNDLRAEQEERKKLQEKLNAYESRNHALMVRLRRFEKTENFDVKESLSDIDSPEPSKRPRLALKHLGDFNTPSPLSNDEFKNRVAHVRESDSPYLMVKSSNIALSGVLKKPMQMKEAHQPPVAAALAKSNSSDGTSKLSIFQKPRVVPAIPSLRSESLVYNGIGGTAKVLQSELRNQNSLSNLWPTTSSSASTKNSVTIRKKKLSPIAALSK